MVTFVQKDFQSCGHVFWRDRNKRILIGWNMDLEMSNSVLRDKLHVLERVGFGNQSPEVHQHAPYAEEESGYPTG